MNLVRGTASVWIVVIVGLIAGCPAVSAPELPGTPTDIDFAVVNATARLALDLTDLNVGLIDEDTFRERFERNGATIQLIDVAPIRYALLIEADGRQVVGLSGTTNLDNNEFNLQVELVFDAMIAGRVHAGYRELALRVRTDLVPRLRIDSPVELVGFSQGGALASLLPLWLAADGFTISRVITLGQPKVADGALAGRLALLPVLRLVAADDIIPGYPRAAEYQHFGRAIVLLSGPTIVSLLPGDPGYADPRELPDALPDLLRLDHATYDLRLASKLGQMVYEVPLDAVAAERGD